MTTASTTYQSVAGLRLFSSDRWWSAFFITDADNAAIRLVYVDIATPVHRVGSTLTFVDLDLDVQKATGGVAEILDRDDSSSIASTTSIPISSLKPPNGLALR